MRTVLTEHTFRRVCLEDAAVNKSAKEINFHGKGAFLAHWLDARDALRLSHLFSV